MADFHKFVGLLWVDCVSSPMSAVVQFNFLRARKFSLR